jgi:protein SCO1
MTAATARPLAALGTLAVILVITASWWALALWPTGDTTPAWLALTREVCFGTSATGLPDAGGWLVLMGQPLSMLLVLFAVWGGNVRAGLQWASQRVSGQLVLGAVSALIVAGIGGAVLRVRIADAQPFASSRTEMVASQLNRINDAPKPMALTDQSGNTISLEQFRGRPVIVTFAFAHCTTICPIIVNDALNTRDKLASHNVVVLVVTLDPWRDTPSRLPSIADKWGMTGDAHVLSGTPEQVERTLNAWRIPRVRNERNGDLSHPSLAYVIGPDGRIAYVVDGSQQILRAAVEAL